MTFVRPRRREITRREAGDELRSVISSRKSPPANVFREFPLIRFIPCDVRARESDGPMQQRGGMAFNELFWIGKKRARLRFISPFYSTTHRHPEWRIN